MPCCEHLAPLLGDDPSDVLALAELEALSSDFPRQADEALR
jgi:hypothetical protein